MNRYIILLIVFVILSIFGSAAYILSHSDKRLVQACAKIGSGQVELECLYGLLETRMDSDGLSAAIELFSIAYNESETFEQTGCHIHAHRVGDMFYFRQYLTGSASFEEMVFPKETASCSYGFFHGFFEHLAQDNPDLIDLERICGTFARNFSIAAKSRAELMCYHGSGHGFMSIAAERAKKTDWGNVLAYTEPALEQCRSYPAAGPKKKGQCFGGVFTVLVSWMEAEEYGFKYPSEILRFCERWSGSVRRACFKEVAQKGDVIAPEGVAELAQVIGMIPDEATRAVVFSTSIAGKMQGNISNGRYLNVLKACMRLSENRKSECVSSIVHGLFELGTPGLEFEEARSFCERVEISENKLSDVCFTRFAESLSDFHTEEEVVVICSTLPYEYQSPCMTKASLLVHS